MKFKKTKLTALAMSVLMAASTITSVTWAADFTDGAPAEAAVEAPVEVVSDVEDAEPAEDAAIVSVSNGEVTDVKDVWFHYSADGKSVVVDCTLVLPNGETQEVKGTTEGVVKGAKAGLVKPATCTEPESAIYLFQWDGFEKQFLSSDPSIVDYACVHVSDSKTNKLLWQNDDGYIRTPGSTPLGGTYGHTPDTKKVEVVVSAATCSASGVKAVYDQCKDCHMIITSKGEYKTAPTTTQLEAGKTGRFLDLDGDDKTDVVYSTIEMNAHTYGTETKIVTDAYIRNYKYGSNAPEVKDLAPFNCYWEDGDVLYDSEGNPIGPNKAVDLPNGRMAVESKERDAYYYTVNECIYCGKAIQAGTEYIKDASAEVGKLDGTYYEPVDNIAGFLWVNPTTGKLDIAPSHYIDGVTRGYKKEEVLHDANGNPIPVMKQGDCTKVGYYKVTVYQGDVNKPVSSVLKEVKGAHAWKSTEVATSGTAIDASGTLAKTEDSKLLTDPKITDSDNPGKFVVVRDAQGNVTEAKSINCVTKAKYQLYHVCMVCGAVEKVGDLKTTDVNSDMHQWGNVWTSDDADSEYVNRGDYHEKYTYKHRTCELCGKRDLQLDKKIKENHTLKETKVEGGEEKEPTCGDPGYYTVQLQCPCGYADSNSIKKTTVPATDKHDFGDNEVEMIVVGSFQVGGRTTTERESSDPTHIVYGTIVRKCKVCGQYDSNGIDNTVAEQGGTLKTSGARLPYVGGTVVADDISPYSEEKTLSNYVPAKVDPTTKVPYACSVGKITVTLKWSGKVDGSPKTLEKEVTVPYYPTETTYAGARAHEAGEVKIEKRVEATTTTPGSYDKVIYCRVCGDEISRETIVLDPTVQVTTPEVLSAVSAGYNSIKVTWAPVANADSYELWYRGGEATRWTLIRKNITATSFTHTSKKLVSGVAYRYTVKAVKGDVKSDYSRKGKVGRPAPVAPVVKSVAFSGSRATVTWSKVAGASGYIIQRKTTGGWTRVGTVKSGSKVTWTDKKAVSGAAYRVRAYRTVENVNVYGPFSAAK